jgi:peptidase M23B
MKSKFISFGLVLILILTNLCVPIYATSQSELEDQKSDLNTKIDETKSQQTEVKEQLSEQRQEIEKLDESITQMEDEISTLNVQIAELENSIQEEQTKLEQKQKEHEENQALMEERLVVMYEYGDTSFLDMLFNSKNIIEFISNYYMLSQITQCDKELLETIEKEQEEIENTKKELEANKEKVSSAKIEKETKNNLLKTQKSQRQAKADSLSAEDKALQDKIDSYNAQVAKIDSDIKKIIEDLNNKNNNSSGSNGLKFDGSFIWPCNNKIITSRVKWRWGRWHKGIDIGARYENVYASASGYAYTLENPGGYGHYIMIIHGDGYITLYGHLNSFKVSYGQYVSQGQVIAQSGNSGGSTGAHLHFEIRKASSISGFFSSSFLNPLDYLPGGYTIYD